MKRFAASVVLALASAVTALSPAMAAHHRPHFVFARLGAGVCDGLVCSGAFFATLSDACGPVLVPSTTRFVRPVRQGVCPSGLGVKWSDSWSGATQRLDIKAGALRGRRQGPAPWLRPSSSAETASWPWGWDGTWSPTIRAALLSVTPCLMCSPRPAKRHPTPT
jgi:hypothetical protein